MKLSRRTDYALRVLLTLVDEQGNGPIPIRELSERNDVPKQFLEHIMLELKEQGWVSSVPGRSGGYELARRPEDISMGQIVRHFQGLLAPIGCVSANRYEHCSQEPACRFRRILLEVRNHTAELMDRATLACVNAGATVARDEVFSVALIYGDGI
jgi:Rrf2 family protein